MVQAGDRSRRLFVLIAADVVSEEADTAQRVTEVAPPAELRNCRSRAEGTAPIEWQVGRADVRLGPLVLGHVRNRRAVGPADHPDWPFAVKAPVLLRARSRVVLAIAPSATAVAAFQHRDGWATAVRFTACFERVRAYAYEGTVGPTTFFPFGIGLRRRAACVPMELWIDGQDVPVRRLVPVGRGRC